MGPAGFDATAIPSAGTSAVVLVTLAIILLASISMFWALVDRWTSRRQWVALSEWARDEGFAFARQLDDRPEPFDLPGFSGIALRLWLRKPSAGLSVIQLGSWNLLVQQLDASWKPTGLRPVQLPESILDRFPLRSFPGTGPSERFVLYGTDLASAELLSRSSTRALLPPDIGLLLHGKNLVLDFSARPLDSIELNRVRAVAAQVIAHLPSPAA